jgi:hypothetical protein
MRFNSLPGRISLFERAIFNEETAQPRRSEAATKVGQASCLSGTPEVVPPPIIQDRLEACPTSDAALPR